MFLEKTISKIQMHIFGNSKNILNLSSNLESSRTMSFSAPSAINLEHSVVKFEAAEQDNWQKSDQSDMYSSKLMSHDSVQIHNDINNTSHDWQSLSCLTDSTEQSAPINFDMSNRVGFM